MTNPTPPPGPQGTTVEEDTIVVDQESMLAAVGKAWWLILILGLVSLVVGIIVLIRPFTAVNVAAIIFGIWLLVSGIFQLVQAFNSRLETMARVLNAITGVIGIILGIICFESVENRIALLILFIGIWWILRGIMQIIIGATRTEGGGIDIFLGIVGLIAGVIVLVWPIGSLAVLTLVVGVWLIVLGIFEVIAAFRTKSLYKDAQQATASDAASAPS